MSVPVIEAKDLKKYFRLGGNATLKAVDGVSFSIEQGRTLGLVGESGCGKSTTGRAVLGMFAPTSGEVWFEGKNTASMTGAERRRFTRYGQMIFQDPYSSLDPRMTVSDIVGEGIDIHGLYRGRERAERIRELLSLVGLAHEHGGRFPHEFSGGQRQRIGIARSLAVEPSFTVISHVFENLVRRVEGNTIPGAAERWETSEDGRTITFHLRDSKWSDGRPVTATDFEYSVKRLLNPDTAAEYAFAAYYITGAEEYNLGRADASAVGIKAVDDKTLVITLKEPTPYFVNFLAHGSFAPSRRDLVEKYGAAYATDADKAAYNGPFILKEWRHEETKILEKNPGYWNADAIKLDSAEIMVIYDTATALNLFENGEFDIVDVPSNMFKQYQDQGTAKLFLNGALDWMKFNLRDNPAKPWLANKNFRLAVGWAIDRESYTLVSTKGLYVPALRFILPIVQGVSGAYGEEYPLDFYSPKGDAAKAKEFLAKALDELKIQASDITMEYLIQDMEETRLMAETLQQQIQNVLGINVKIKLVTRMQRQQLEANGEFDTVYSGWMPDYDDPMSYEEIWVSSSSHNSAKYSNEAYDKFVQGALVEKDAKKRMDMIFAAEKQILEDAPLVPLQLRRKAWMSAPGLKNFSRPLIGAEYDFAFAYFE